jgi:hypothetical protein
MEAVKAPYRHQRHGRLNAQHAAGARAIRCWICAVCEIPHRPKDGVCICRDPACEAKDNRSPKQCRCGSITFTLFPSYTEAKAWLGLRFLEKNNLISNLRRQVWFDLLAYGPEGQAAKVGSYVADFVYVENSVEIIADAKPKSGTDDLADLKLRIMGANGRPVKIIS